MTPETWAILAIILVPSAIVSLAAIARGYHIHIIRPRKDDEHGND